MCSVISTHSCSNDLMWADRCWIQTKWWMTRQRDGEFKLFLQVQQGGAHAFQHRCTPLSKEPISIKWNNAILKLYFAVPHHIYKWNVWPPTSNSSFFVLISTGDPISCVYHKPSLMLTWADVQSDVFAIKGISSIHVYPAWRLVVTWLYFDSGVFYMKVI